MPSNHAVLNWDSPYLASSLPTLPDATVYGQYMNNYGQSVNGAGSSMAEPRLKTSSGEGNSGTTATCGEEEVSIFISESRTLPDIIYTTN